MLSKLERKRKEAEIAKLKGGISGNELTILEREADIEHMHENIQKQKDRIEQLESELLEDGGSQK